MGILERTLYIGLLTVVFWTPDWTLNLVPSAASAVLFWVLVFSTWAAIVLWLCWNLFLFFLFLPDTIAEWRWQVKLKYGLQWNT